MNFLERPAVKAVAIVLILAASVSTYLFGQRMMEERRTVARLTLFRDSLSLLRRDAETCQASVNQEEAQFQAFNDGVDSLRGVVREYEGEDGAEGDRRVPEEQYEEYLEVFDRYNASVEEWEARRVRLEQRSDLCRRLFVEHNRVVDTLRTLSAEFEVGG